MDRVACMAHVSTQDTRRNSCSSAGLGAWRIIERFAVRARARAYGTYQSIKWGMEGRENPLSETELPFQKLLSETAFRNCHDLFRNCGFFETETLFRFSFKSQLHTIVGVRPYLAMLGLRRFEAALSRVGVVMEVSGLTSVGMVSHCTCLIQVCQYCSNVGVRPYLGRKGFDCRCPALHRTYTRVSSFSRSV